MFAKLPQKLPFNLLGDEAKLAFRSRQGGIAKLAAARVSTHAILILITTEFVYRTSLRPTPTGNK